MTTSLPLDRIDWQTYDLDHLLELAHAQHHSNDPVIAELANGVLALEYIRVSLIPLLRAMVIPGHTPEEQTVNIEVARKFFYEHCCDCLKPLPPERRQERGAACAECAAALEQHWQKGEL